MNFNLNNISYSCVPMYSNNKELIALSCSNKIIENFVPVWTPNHWQNTIIYNGNTLVEWDNKIYISIANEFESNKNKLPPNNPLFWQIIDSRVTNYPFFNSYVSYKKDDIVFSFMYNKLIKAKLDMGPGNGPSRFPGNWEIYNLPASG